MIKKKSFRDRIIKTADLFSRKKRRGRKSAFASQIITTKSLPDVLPFQRAPKDSSPAESITTDKKETKKNEEKD